MPIRILIADDHHLLRQGIRNFLALEPDFDIIGEAADGEEAVAKAEALNPDILLLDINMPKLTGIEVAARLKASNPAIRVLALTIHDDENYMMKMIQSGAAGYLLKDVDPSMMVQGIRRRIICRTVADQKTVSGNHQPRRSQTNNAGVSCR